MREYLKAIWKSNKKVIILPVLVLAMVMVGIIALGRMQYLLEGEELVQHFLPEIQIFLPLMCGWWTLIIHSPFVEKKGNEVLYLYIKPRTILTCQITVELLFLILLFGVYMLTKSQFPVPAFLFGQICVECLTIGGFLFLMVGILKNMGAAFGVVLAYSFFVNKLDAFCVFQPVSIYFSELGKSAENVDKMCVVLGLSVLFHLLGYLSVKYRRVYL